MGRNRKDAFTLIELLVVIAVIAIIAAILFPVLVAARKKAYQATCLSNLSQIRKATMLYMDDWDDTFPWVLCFAGNGVVDANYGDDGKHPVEPGFTGTEPRFRLVTLVMPYVKNENVWYCPAVGPDYVSETAVQANGGKRVSMRDQGTTYGYTYRSFDSSLTRSILMGGKQSARLLLDPGRWPMLWEQPNGYRYTGSISDPPATVVPHFAGMNVAYGDGHAKFVRMETAGAWIGRSHSGDGLFPGQ